MLDLTSLLRTDVSVLKKWTASSEVPVQLSAAFIKSQTFPHEKVYILSRQSGFYYYLSDTLCPLKIPGTLELFSVRDLDTVLSAIQSEQLSKLFVDKDFYNGVTYNPEVFAQISKTISEHYLPAKTSPDGQLTLYVPK